MDPPRYSSPALRAQPTASSARPAARWCLLAAFENHPPCPDRSPVRAPRRHAPAPAPHRSLDRDLRRLGPQLRSLGEARRVQKQRPVHGRGRALNRPLPRVVRGVPVSEGHGWERGGAEVDSAGGDGRGGGDDGQGWACDGRGGGGEEKIVVVPQQLMRVRRLLAAAAAAGSGSRAGRGGATKAERASDNGGY